MALHSYSITLRGRRRRSQSPLVGKEGTLVAHKFSIRGSDDQDHIILAAMTDDGLSIDPAAAKRLFELPVRKTAAADAPLPDTMKVTIGVQRKIILDEMAARQSEWFDDEIDKLDSWAEDKRAGLKADLKELDEEIRALKKEVRQTGNLPDKLALQRKARALEATRQALQSACETRTLNSDLEIKVLSTSIEAVQREAQQALATVLSSYEKVTGKALTDTDKLDEAAKDVAHALANVELLKSMLAGKSLDQIDFESVKSTIRAEEGGEKRQELAKAITKIGKLETLLSPDQTAIAGEQAALQQKAAERDALLKATRGDLFKALYDAADVVIAGGEWPNDEQCPLCDSELDHSINEHVKRQGQTLRTRPSLSGDSRGSGQFAKRRDDLLRAVGLWQKATAFRQVVFADDNKARGRDDLDRWPSSPNKSGELQAIH